MTPKREIDLTQRSRSDHADRGRSNRIKRLRARLDTIGSDTDEHWLDVKGVLKGILDLLDDEL